MFSEYRPYSITCGDLILDLRNPVVMGILNTSRDSFFDGGLYRDHKSVMDRCETMLKEGATIIDIGAQSTRPGAEIIPVEEEILNTVSYIESIRKTFPGTIISIDTFHSETARRAADAGAVLINDISSGDDDPGMITTVARLGIPYICMHKKGIPKTMQENPQYHDVSTEVINYLDRKIIECNEAGIREVIVDPGFGFGKNMTHNYSLLRHLDLFHNLERPLLIGISRKSMIYKLLESDAGSALNGSTCLHTLALIQGAHILRVHDVKEAVECIKIISYLGRV